ncbi:hypothetical protein [Moorena sp. SIO3H5]|uniref:hypothetical protein n=1 Tax=Moorena sp. SIO3H5 TaxID=2607834 RepID=UPI0013BC5EBF|nr:hypothetical protein [Moorena sp. SIO3H5]NEO70565.1 hypothetical protein [Moorena sp. SIO3H5]
MRYTLFFPSSLFPAPCSLLPAPCSLKPRDLYLMGIILAIFTTPYFEAPKLWSPGI